MRLRFFIFYCLVIATGVFIHFRTTVEVSLSRPLEAFPRSVSDWRMSGRSEFSESILKVLRPTDYLARRYVGRSGEVVDLYIGYYDGGPDSGGIHSPRHCLPGSGWNQDFHEELALVMQGGKLNLVNAVYSKGGSRRFFSYWFQVNGNTINDEYSLKTAEILNSLIKNRNDSAFVRISTVVSNENENHTFSTRKFIEDFYPVIQSFLSS